MIENLAVSNLPVQLLTDSVLTQSTVTHRGTFTFTRFKPGLERAVLLVAGVPIDTTTAIDANSASASFPDSLVLGTYGPVYVAPNPVTGSAVIYFALARPDTVSVQIRSLAGAVVKQLVYQATPAGQFAVTWDGSTDAGSTAAPGTYCVIVDKRVVLSAEPMTARALGVLDVGPITPSLPESGPILCTIVIKQ